LAHVVAASPACAVTTIDLQHCPIGQAYGHGLVAEGSIFPVRLVLGLDSFDEENNNCSLSVGQYSFDCHRNAVTGLGDRFGYRSYAGLFGHKSNARNIAHQRLYGCQNTPGTNGQDYNQDYHQGSSSQLRIGGLEHRYSP
jgi:hypothetical protein